MLANLPPFNFFDLFLLPPLPKTFEEDVGWFSGGGGCCCGGSCCGGGSGGSCCGGCCCSFSLKIFFNLSSASFNGIGV